ncbi:hypothetical protein VTP01DRAFT_264 [Rhizomucor pusillus]|uniref:uncharacterized protein n=1 Tax=Rhizomucor pusillus TaxID=4840 RepID=UPI003744649C
MKSSALSLALSIVVSISSAVPLLILRADNSSSEIGSFISEESSTSAKKMVANIDPEGAATGFIAASPSKSNPDDGSDYEKYLKDYVTFQINAMGESTVCNCLGEPKFNADCTSYTGAWGRPQNDGPATRATAFMLIADALSGNSSYVNDTLTPAIKRDLDYVTSVWQNACYDLWEEVNGVHFYTLMVMRRALKEGASFLGNSSYSETASFIEDKLQSFYSESDGYVTVTQDNAGGVDYKSSGLDASTLIAANLGGMGDGFFTPGSDKILATSLAIKSAFADLYTINKDNSSGLAPAIGRYPEDKYDGISTSEGNPWFLTTLAFPELYLRAIDEWKAAGSVKVSDISEAFFKQFDLSAVSGTEYSADSKEFANLTAAIKAEAETFFARVQHHITDGSMTEEIDRDSGEQVGAHDLTWSYASFITAAAAYNGSPVS